MTIITPDELEFKVYEASRSAFSDLVNAHPEDQFYTFGLWTDDSLQFLHPVANTEDGLDRVVRCYREEFDPKYSITSTHDGMRWSYGDWVFFPNVGEKQFSDINKNLNSIFHLEISDERFSKIVESLWEAIVKGFARLDAEGFFGVGDERLRITLLIVGDLPEELMNFFARELNPAVVSNEYVNWTVE